jgi:WD40 repeat protein
MTKPIVPYSPTPLHTPQNIPPLNLPLDIVFTILSNVKFNDIIRFSLVCRETNWISAANDFMQRLFYRSFPQVPSHNVVHFQHRYIVHSNMATNNDFSRTLKGHTSAVTALKVCQDMHVLVSSTLTTLKVWDFKTTQCIATLHEEFIGSIDAITTYHKMIVSGGSDRKIRFWDLDTKTSKFSLETNSHIFCLASDDKSVVSGDLDSVTVWDVDARLPKIRCVSGFPVTALALKDDTAFVGGNNGQLTCLNLTTGQYTTPIQAHSNEVNSLIIHGEEIYTCSNDGSIKIWDCTTLELKKTLAIDGERFSALEMWDGVLISASWSSVNFEQYVRMWDLTTGGYQVIEQVKSKWKIVIYKDTFITNDSTTGIQLCDFSVSEDRIRYTLLQHLGIVTKKDFEHYLRCEPEDLQRVGLKTREDIDLICSPCTHIQPLEIIHIEEVEEDDKKMRTIALNRKDNLLKLSNDLAAAIDQHLDDCRVARWGDDTTHYQNLQLQLREFQTKLHKIITDCSGNPKGIVPAFSLENYNQLASELNQLVNKFQSTEQFFQIIKLHDYIHQGMTLGLTIHFFAESWAGLHASGINSLQDLPQERKTFANLLETCIWAMRREN